MLASNDCIDALSAAPCAGTLSAAQPRGASWTTAAWGCVAVVVLPSLPLHAEEQSSRPLSDPSGSGGV